MWRWGSFLGPYGTIDGTDCRNDIAYLKQAGEAKDNTSLTRLNAFLKADIMKGLTLNADYTINLVNRNYKEAGNPVYAYNTWGGNISSPSYLVTKSYTYVYDLNAKETTWAVNVYANYNKVFANDYNLYVMLGGN